MAVPVGTVPFALVTAIEKPTDWPNVELGRDETTVAPVDAFATTWLRVPVLPRWFASPPYVATSDWVPAVRSLRAIEHVPLESEHEPSGRLPFANVTAPVGVVPSALVTVNVNVTAAPKTELAGAAPIATDVALATAWKRIGETSASWLASPRYAAVSEYAPLGSAAVVTAHVPAASVQVPIGVVPSRTVTVPVGVVPWAATTVVVKVTAWP